MKKKQFLFPVLILMAFFCFAFSKTAKADVDYDITNVNVKANVNKDGSLTIHRLIKYDFDSDAHGVYYRQNLNHNQRLLNQKVTISTNDGKTVTVKKGAVKNNSYELTHDDNGYRFKVYHDIDEDDTVKVNYSYTITNAVTNWRDIAELNFKIIGNHWDTDLDYAKVTINFNNGQKIPSLKAWAHGSLSGYIKVNRHNGTVIMSDNDVPGDVGMEIHAIFPTSITPLNKNTRDKNHKKAVISQEIALAKEANRKRARKRLINTLISFALLALSLLMTILLIIKTFVNRPFGVKPRRYSDLPHNYDIPTVSPVMAQMLDNGDLPDTRAFTAYLTALAAKKQIKIEKIDKKGKQYRVTLINPDIKNDSKFLKQIVEIAGDGRSFTTSDLADAEMGKKFYRWQKEQYRLTNKENFIDQKFDKEYDETHGRFKASGIFTLILMVILLAFIPANKWFAGILLILAILDWLMGPIYRRRNSIYTQKGADETNKIRGFKKMLADIGNFKMKDVGELIFWEDVMPYAVAFGLSKKVLKELKVEFSEEELDTVFPATSYYWYMSTHNGFEHSLSNSISSSSDVGSRSSSSGSSGGFSGGSSGGFGGGSGGGAF